MRIFFLFLLLAFLTSPHPAVQRMDALRNGGFESIAPHEGWSLHVYGAQPNVALAPDIHREGRQSLRISASEPSDTALGQEIQLRAGRWYRFSGWVRTRGLDPHGSPVFGTYQIQLPGGRGVIATGQNHSGDTEWVEVPIYFRAPAGGLTRIAIFFVGYGKGTGTAWFDNLKVEEVDISKIPIKVTREPLNSGTISPYQYGQFIEYLCNLVPGMWAEKLYDGSFEGLSPYKFEFLKETDFKEKPWYPTGSTNRAAYTLDRLTKVSGEVSQKIAVEGSAPCVVGISQDGVAVQKGATCDLSIWIKALDLRGPVRVRLHHEDRTYATCDIQAGNDWRKHRAELTPSDTDPNATLSISFSGPGTLWLDNASLMPREALTPNPSPNSGRGGLAPGWRRDVLEAVRALKPGIIRFGGSTVDYSSYSDYDWRKTIGDPDHRTPFRSWGGLQPTGPGLEEIVQFIRAVGAEPLICVRFIGSTPEEAAAQVHYFNDSPKTPMGAQRTINGHARPYHIRYWQVGNEVSGPEYAAKLAGFCRAMKEVDPSIKLLSSYPSEAVVRNAGELLDYLCPHHYGCDDLGAMKSSFDEMRRLIGSRPMKVAVTEWNTTAGDAGPRRAMLWTLANALACSRYQNLLHRECDIAEIANRSNLTNSFCSGIIQTDNHRLYKTPTYYAQQLYATLAGNRPLRLESEIPADSGLDISATLSADGKNVTLFAVNDGLDDVVRPLDLSALGATGRPIEAWTLADKHRAGEPDVTNDFANPERVAPVKSSLHAPASRFDYRYPALSLTILQVKLEVAQD